MKLWPRWHSYDVPRVTYDLNKRSLFIIICFILDTVVICLFIDSCLLNHCDRLIIAPDGDNQIILFFLCYTHGSLTTQVSFYLLVFYSIFQHIYIYSTFTNLFLILA